jgi:hypothetical protein
MRFRAVLMTAIAFIVGLLPLVLATGAGANARVHLGFTVLGGMLAATLFGILLIPGALCDVPMDRGSCWRLAGEPRRCCPCCRGRESIRTVTRRTSAPARCLPSRSEEQLG